MARVFLFRTSWNSSSEKLGLSVDGATVPPTLPEALTWGNKFPIASDPALFPLLPSKPKGPTLKNAGWGWGTLTDPTVGWGGRGDFKFFNFYFHVLSFVKVWALGFCCLVCVLRGMRWDSKGLFH